MATRAYYAGNYYNPSQNAYAAQVYQNMARQRYADNIAQARETEQFFERMKKKEVSDFLSSLTANQIRAAQNGVSREQFYATQPVQALEQISRMSPSQQAEIMNYLAQQAGAAANHAALTGNFAGSQQITNALGLPGLNNQQLAAMANNPQAVAAMAQQFNPYASNKASAYNSAALAEMAKSGSVVNSAAMWDKVRQEQQWQRDLLNMRQGAATRGGGGGLSYDPAADVSLAAQLFQKISPTDPDYQAKVNFAKQQLHGTLGGQRAIAAVQGYANNLATVPGFEKHPEWLQAYTQLAQGQGQGQAGAPSFSPVPENSPAFAPGAFSAPGSAPAPETGPAAGGLAGVGAVGAPAPQAPQAPAPNLYAQPANMNGTDADADYQDFALQLALQAQQANAQQQSPLDLILQYARQRELQNAALQNAQRHNPHDDR